MLKDTNTNKETSTMAKPLATTTIRPTSKTGKLLFALSLNDSVECTTSIARM